MVARCCYRLLFWAIGTAVLLWSEIKNQRKPQAAEYTTSSCLFVLLHSASLWTIFQVTSASRYFNTSLAARAKDFGTSKCGHRATLRSESLQTCLLCWAKELEHAELIPSVQPTCPQCFSVQPPCPQCFSVQPPCSQCFFVQPPCPQCLSVQPPCPECFFEEDRTLLVKSNIHLWFVYFSEVLDVCTCPGCHIIRDYIPRISSEPKLPAVGWQGEGAPGSCMMHTNCSWSNMIQHTKHPVACLRNSGTVNVSHL